MEIKIKIYSLPLAIFEIRESLDSEVQNIKNISE